MTRAEFYRKLVNGERLFGLCLSHASPVWVDLPSRLGLDFVFIDMEHFPFSEAEVAYLCRAHAACGVAPFVRVPGVDGPYARRAKFWGAWGVVAPYIEHADEAEALVAAVKWDPLRGEKLRAWREHRNAPAASLDYLRGRNADVAVLVNIESVPGVERLGQILAVPGVDAALIGPHDLSISLGIPEQYDDPEFLRQVSSIISTCRRLEKPVGVHVWWDLQREQRWLEEGISFLIHSTDLIVVEKTLRQELQTLRGGPAAGPPAGGSRVKRG